MAEDLTARNRARVDALYAAYLAGDMASVIGAMAEDVRWVSGEDTASAPWSGERIGREGVQAYFAALAAECRILDYRIGQIIVDGDWAAVTATVRARFHRSGMEQELDKVDVLRLRDGQVAEFREYYDTSAIAVACAV
ncbi:nuclear transport factor 2 family protein [Roseomonas sp. CAU 1739]|uniref:nuclear transport factor 2 family protein n=1 Tax=Roseomonas sp. CAU 1739 TaxID=3140364 RepID=UPI00325B8BD8